MLVYRDFDIRPWQPQDREAVAALIATVLGEFGLAWEPQGADADVVAVEAFYQDQGGEFWVIEQAGQIVGTAAYYPIARGENAVEIRKMYLHPQARGQGLGQFLLSQLEQQIHQRGFDLIWIETATIMNQAVKLYEKNGYQPTSGIETQRCDRVYYKTLG
ncbi:GNAT family N-acetyltransferase [Thermosynechococcaceae cyanobacterium BACA0444]|uniref:GNAT family N-acetyltransferase n=1 Tax=Pseudocalidococcus azoricus BACA0444 TaxID=2918990 RepID=A0AAE4FSR2_9CYAN|nr:GNAT family N-acetyltransferase [Pseudocalidococcus azoricus]MDS3861619.1 GNAT family N-acetyltransferase [Pseudocalidococcus azoricus BACA0444]